MDNILLFQPFPVDYYFFSKNMFTVKSEDYNINGAYFPSENSDGSNVSILFYIGNGGSMNGYSHVITLMNGELGYNFAIFEYRGYGQSEGKPSEEGCYKDAQAVINYLSNLSNFNTNNLFFMGWSLGTAVATEMSLSNKPTGLILISGFTSLDDMADSWFSYPLPGEWFLNSKFDTYSKIDKIGVPVQFIHGSMDSTVPTWMSETNFQKAKDPKHLKIIEGASHNDIFYYEDLKHTVTNFIREYEK